ncbi:hypothetical protein GMRT_14388 [Giardia muris]|uniref:Uncharacterized protein n=1 Tax=Giardia muris TaxID=5742 RepID=A0A4Z1SQW0_GIAMU|nr:hypothetical protein GMRT_14388 [Giardia muris]|eukprot:TNJ28236.1 hypothetical protein GMRT_14388 [Giardia muris]
MSTKKPQKQEPRVPTRADFDGIHVAYTAKTRSLMVADVTKIFAETLSPIRSLLDEAIIDYITEFLYECRRESLEYHKMYVGYRLLLYLFHALRHGVQSDKLSLAVASKLNYMMSPIEGFEYCLDEITTADFENPAEPISVDDDHDQLVYLDELWAKECYKTLSGGHSIEVPRPPSQQKSVSSQKARSAVPPPVETKYSFVLAENEAVLLARLYRPLLQSPTLWTSCFSYARPTVCGLESVPIPAKPHTRELPPLNESYPYKKLPPLEAKIISYARPRMAKIFRELQDYLVQQGTNTSIPGTPSTSGGQRNLAK